MSTNSSIRIKRTDGTVTGIYCHWDGYIENNGVILQLAYNTPERVEQLLSLGDISTLRYYTEPNDILEAKDNVCRAYHRDNGEQFRQTLQDAEYIYTYDEEQRVWYVEQEEIERCTPAIELLALPTQFFKRQALLIDEIIKRTETINSEEWITDEYAEQGKVVEACIQRAKEARADIVKEYYNNYCVFYD